MSNYWLKREEEALKHYITDEKEYSKHIEKIYRNMMDVCQKEIEAFYGKYAKEGNISLSEAKKRVSGLDVEAFGRKAKKYVEEKNFSAQANKELKLYNATMKINRLEMLKANIGLELISGFDELNDYMGQILKDRAIEELERQAGILGESISDNAKFADSIVNSSFHNATFSDRLWQYQSVMRSDLSKLIESGLIQGKSARVLAREIRKYYIGSGKLKNGRNGAIYSSERLMRTELARVQIEAQKKSFEANDFDEYIFLANSTCCSECRKMHNKHFKVKKMMTGVNAPPMHPNCRCSTAAYEDSEEYEAWLDYLDNSGSTEEWNSMKTVAKNSGSVIMKSGAKSGALTDKNDPLYEKRDKHAEMYYESVRNSKKAPIVKSISQNSGFSEAYVSKVFDHVFVNEYDLYGGKRRFESDYDMAESFRRLREGKNIQEHDIILLRHEHLEYGLMNKLGISYDEAHELTQRKYDYAAALEKFKKKNNL
jgi:SPP1 gp7 family putative phage head morphogenesis protein